ncbi:MAG: hypothetical protein ACFBWO_17450 [Paracoccaceae bacterium]
MTNHVINRWELEGPPEAIDAFEALALTEPVPDRRGRLARVLGRPPAPSVGARTLDPERILPTPPRVARDPGAARDWRLAHWGFQHWDPEPTWYERAGPARATLLFHTPWSAGSGLLAALAARVPPALTIRASDVEPGNACAGRSRVEAGRFSREEVAFTRTFYEAVAGEPLDDDV